MLKTAGSTLPFAATGVAGVAYSGRAPKMRAGSWQNGAHSSGGHGSSRQSRWPASLSADVSYTVPFIGTADAPMNSRFSLTISMSGSGVSRLAQLAERSPSRPRRLLRAACSVGAIKVIIEPLGTAAETAALSVTDVG